MPVVRSRLAESGTVTKSFMPSNESAVPNLPIAQVAPEMVPGVAVPRAVGRGRAAALVEAVGGDEADRAGAVTTAVAWGDGADVAAASAAMTL